MKHSLTILFLLLLTGVFGLAGCPSQDVKDSKAEPSSLDGGLSKADGGGADQPPPPPKKTVSEILTEARNLKAASNFKEAIVKYKEALERKPNLYRAWYNIGVLQDYISPTMGGETAYRKCLSLKPGYYPAINNLFRLYLRQQRRSQAASLIQNKGNAYPADTRIRNLMIRYYIYANRLQMAESMARAIQKKDERNAEAIMNLGLIWFKQKKYELARFAFKNTIKIAKDALFKRRSKAPKKKTLGLKKKTKTKKRDPAEYKLILPETYYQMAFVRLKLRGENKKNYRYILNTYLEPALKMRPVYPEAMGLQAELLMRLGQYKKAESILRQVIKFNPKLWAARLNLGIALTQQSRREEAATTLIAILKENAYFTVAHYQLGILYLEENLKANFGAIQASLYEGQIPTELRKVKRLVRTVKSLVRWGTAAYHLQTFVSSKSNLPADSPARGYLKTAQKQLNKMKKRLKQRVRSERRKYLKRLKKKNKGK